MPFNGIGVYTPIAAPDFPAVPLTTIRAAQFNTNILDIAAALTQCITRDGQSTVEANIPFSGFRVTGAGDGVSAGDYTTLRQLASTDVEFGGSALIGNSVQRVNTVATLKTIPVTVSRDMVTQGYWEIGDGGHGRYRGVTGAAPGTYVDNAGSVIVPTGGNGSSAWLLEFAGEYDVRQFGAKGLNYGAVDDSAAIQAAITALPALSGGRVKFSGIFPVTAQIFVNKDHVTLCGDSSRGSAIWVQHDLGSAVIVQHATSPGTQFVNSFGMARLTIRARVATNSGECLLLNKVQSVFVDDVTLEDHFGGIQILGGAQHFYNNLNITSPRSSAPVSWSGVKTGSCFFKVGRASDLAAPIELFVNNFNFRRNETVNWVEHGIVINCVDGIWFNNGHVMGVASDDIRIEPSAGTEAIDGIKLSNVWLDNNSTFGLRVIGNTTGLYGAIELGNVNFSINLGTGIFIEATAVNFEGIRMSGGSVRRAGNYGALIRAGRRHLFSGVEFGACNTSAGANAGGISVDGGADKVQVVGCIFDQTALGVTASSMIGVVVQSGASTQVQVTGSQFDLVAADIQDSSSSNANRYDWNVTTKPATALSVSGTSLVIAEIGDQFYVSAGLNFDNVTGRWDQREVSLIFAGASTITHSVTGIRLAGSVNFVAKAGDVLSLVFSPDLGHWIEKSRMVS